MRGFHIIASTVVSLTLLLQIACNGGGSSSNGAASKQFNEQVIPVLERDCGGSACHAAEGNRYDTLPTSYFAFPVDELGNIAGADRISKAYQRSLAKLASAGAEFSDLVRKPLDESLGGLPHRGGSQYRSMDETRLNILMSWGDAARPADEGPLPALIQRFKDEIQPVLAEKRCMLSSCHGASAANLLIFDPGFLGRFDRHATLRNYKTAILHMNLESPDVMLSRLIRKAIPLDQGGIFHRGGNTFFDPAGDDPALQTLTRFITDTRTELGDQDKGIVTGLVFAATDATPRQLFDITAWQPGGDIYSLIPVSDESMPNNLTENYHTGDVDIRDPDVSYDGSRIAFSMRRNQQDCLNLYVMNIDGLTAPVQITFDNTDPSICTDIANVEPLWGPDDRIYFISSRGGVLSASGNYPLSNIWRVNADGSGLLRMSFSPGNEVAPAWRFFPAKGKERPEIRTLDLTFTSTRRVGGEMFAPLMRVPPDFRADYHPHFGTQNPNYQIFTSMSQFVDLREVLILMDEENQWEGGALALIDRNLGPIIADGGTAAVVRYEDPLQKLTETGRNIEHKGDSANGYFRDPVAMPDGSIVVSYSSAGIDLADPAEQPKTALYRLTLREQMPNKVSILSKELLKDILDKVETDPKPIMLRRREEIEDATVHLQNGIDSGEMLNFDLAVALTVAEQDSPSNTKDFDAMADRIQYVRLVEEVPPTRQADIGEGGHGIRRIIGEFEATSDRSVYVQLPAGVAFFIQALDNNLMATSTFNQWFFVLPGEKLKQVTRREVWNGRCGACHGSKSGIPGDTVTTPDVLTQASRVVANYDEVSRTDLAPVPYGIEPGQRIEVDFVTHIQDIISGSCAIATCHVAGAETPDLSGNAYTALTATGTFSGNNYAYVDPVSSSARSSYLAEVLLNEDLGPDAPGDFANPTVNHTQTLTTEELTIFIRWMDLGANNQGIGSMDKPELPVY